MEKEKQIFVHNPAQEQTETALMKDDLKTSKCKQATLHIKK